MNKEKIEELSLEEKIALLSGTNYMLYADKPNFPFGYFFSLSC